MKPASPKVSVLLPVRDGEPYFAEALESIIAQQGVDFEIVVVDDGSSDGTSERLAACNDPRLVVIRRKGEGLVTALNCALAVCNCHCACRMAHPFISSLFNRLDYEIPVWTCQGVRRKGWAQALQNCG